MTYVCMGNPHTGTSQGLHVQERFRQEVKMRCMWNFELKIRSDAVGLQRAGRSFPG